MLKGRRSGEMKLSTPESLANNLPRKGSIKRGILSEKGKRRGLDGIIIIKLYEVKGRILHNFRNREGSRYNEMGSFGCSLSPKKKKGKTLTTSPGRFGKTWIEQRKNQRSGKWLHVPKVVRERASPEREQKKETNSENGSSVMWGGGVMPPKLREKERGQSRGPMARNAGSALRLLQKAVPNEKRTAGQREIWGIRVRPPCGLVRFEGKNSVGKKKLFIRRGL